MHRDLLIVVKPFSIADPNRGRRDLRPGTMVTMDYVASRLNARVDPMGRIVSLTCG